MLFLENLVFRAKEDAKFFYLQFMVSMASPVVEAHKKLLDEWSKEKRDLVKVEKLLEELRVRGVHVEQGIIIQKKIE